jgi:hypothetical protein
MRLLIGLRIRFSGLIETAEVPSNQCPDGVWARADPSTARALTCRSVLFRLRLRRCLREVSGLDDSQL